MQLKRFCSIAIRTAHIGVSGVLVGGHVFDVSRERLLVWLYLAILTGALMVVVEAYPHIRWAYQGRGLLVWIKLLLLGLIPWCWPHRVWLLAAVIVLASFGSHMPAKFRYFSLLHGRVLDEPQNASQRSTP